MEEVSVDLLAMNRLQQKEIETFETNKLYKPRGRFPLRIGASHLTYSETFDVTDQTIELIVVP